MSHPIEKIRNVAIVGHGGSGKTMLAEHLLYTAGAAEKLGAIQDGTTQSDSDPLEKQRGISLSASVMPLDWSGVRINLIDVPGYPDFIGDLAAVSRVVDAMIFVVEAKAELDVGFDLAWHYADREGLPRCIFINKLESEHADYPGLMEALDQRFGAKAVTVQLPVGMGADFSGVIDLAAMKAFMGRDRGRKIEEIPGDYTAEAAYRREKMMDAAAETSDELMARYLDGEELTEAEIEAGLQAGAREGKVIPIFLGSAATGIGIAPLLDHIIGELPSPIYHPVHTSEGLMQETADAPLLGFVFKTMVDPYLGQLSCIRLYRGRLKPGQKVVCPTSGQEAVAHSLFTPHGSRMEPSEDASAGGIIVVPKLEGIHTGDTLTAPGETAVLAPLELPQASCRIAFHPADKSDEDKLHTALAKLMEEDPSLRHTRDPRTHQDLLEGLGDVHIESAIQKLRQRFGVKIEAEEARIPYLETLTAPAKAQGRHKRQSGGKGQFGDCWIEVEPLPRGAGFEFCDRTVGGCIPKGFLPAIEKGVRDAMSAGAAAGFPVVDVKVTVVDGSHHDVDSNEAAFRSAGAIAFRAAAEQARPQVLEPILEVKVDVPELSMGDVMGDLTGRRGQIVSVEPHMDGVSRIIARVPMAEMRRYAQDLRALTHGRGQAVTEISGYEEAPAAEAQRLSALEAERRASVQ